MSGTTDGAAGTGEAPPSERYTRYVVGILLAVYTLNFLDRQIVSILAAPIKDDLGLSNTQLGLVTGVAFALFYSVLGLPIAWAADRYNRVRILSGACALWSAMTALCGFAGNFAQLFVLRVGVGVGEAACVPCAHSIISDRTEGAQRAAALGVFAMGIPLGTLGGLWVGGVLADAYGWRVAFFALGAPGLALALLALLTIREPSRSGGGALAPSAFAASERLLRNRSFLGLTAAAATASLSGYGLVSFLGVFFVERFALSLAQIGFGLGLAIGIGGAAGAFAGGRLASWFGGPTAARRIAAMGLIAAGPFILLALVSPTPVIAFMALLVVSALNAGWYGPIFSDIQGVADPRSRAMAAAIFNLAVNLLGLGLGPLIIGVASDAAAASGLGSVGALRVGLSIAIVFNILAAVILMAVKTATGPSARSASRTASSSHPPSFTERNPAMMDRNDVLDGVFGADRLIAGLAEGGVRVIFSNPGTSELDLVTALERQQTVRTVPVVFEGVASGAADGYGRIARKPAATLLHLAPGYHNAAANLHNAKRARTPIVNLVGDHATSHLGYDTPLNADLEMIAQPHAAWLKRLDRAEGAAADGLQAAREAVRRRGQATLLVSADAAWTEIRTEDTPPAPPPPARVDASAVESAARALRQASAPALLVGGEGLGEDGLRSCERLSAAGIRVLSELFPARQARGVGMFSPEKLQYFTEAARQQLKECDLVVVAGAPEPAGVFAYRDRPATPLPEGCVLLGLELDPATIVASLEALADAIGAGSADTPARPAGERPSVPEGPLTVNTLAASVGRHLPEHAIVSDDGVTASGFVQAATANAPPHDWLSLTGGALGQGMPVAIGAAMAAPDRKAICITGDGAALYTIQSLWTIGREELDIVIVVVANGSYDILKFELTRMPHTNAPASVMDALGIAPPQIDFCAIARSFGVRAHDCADAGQFDKVFADAMAERGPVLIAARTPSLV